MTSWKLGSTDLTTFGRVTLINDYMDIANRRGENIVIPHRHGAVHVQKFYDQRKIDFGLVVIGTDTTDLEGQMDDLRALISLRTLQTLEMTMNDASVRNISVIVDVPLEVERVSPVLAKCILEFTAPDPFWRSATETIETNTIDASPKAVTVTNAGTVEERDPVITLTGPLENTVITNSTNGCVLTYTGVIAGGSAVIISTINGEYTAVLDGVTNVIGNVSHSGSSALMVFNVGDNTLAITDSTATTGEVKIEFYPPFA